MDSPTAPLTEASNPGVLDGHAGKLCDMEAGGWEQGQARERGRRQSMYSQGYGMDSLCGSALFALA